MSREKFIALGRVVGVDCARRADAADLAAALPAADIEQLRQTGFLRLTIPEQFGGLGANMADALAAQVELAKGSPSTALVAAMQTQIFGNEREIRLWSEEHFTQFCLAANEGGLFNSIASEPLLGSPSRGGTFQTTAVAEPAGGWRLNGHKTWSTGGRHLTHMLVRADIDGKPGVVFVDGSQAGIRWEESWGTALSLRASDSHDLFFEDVLIPAEHLVIHGMGKRDLPPNVWFPMVTASVYLGAALGARDRLIQYCLERVPTALGRSIATLPKIQRQIGEIDLALQAAQALFFNVAEAWNGAPDRASRAQFMARVAAAKQQVVKTALTATDQALAVAGGISITKALPLERYFRDVRAGQMQPPSGDAALEMIGRAAIGVIEK